MKFSARELRRCLSRAFRLNLNQPNLELLSPTSINLSQIAGEIYPKRNFVMDVSESNGEYSSSETKVQPQKFKIYTKTGDAGTSSLYNGNRRSKDDLIFKSLGDVDELNSNLGMAYELSQQIGLEDTCKQLQEIQSRLLDVGSAIATPLDSSSLSKVNHVRFPADALNNLENWIDKMDETLPPLKNFILPSGGVASAQLHISRSVCRRAERRVVSLLSLHLVDVVVLKYLNRLSDYLFVAARLSASKCGKPETIYKKS